MKNGRYCDACDLAEEEEIWNLILLWRWKRRRRKRLWSERPINRSREKQGEYVPRSYFLRDLDVLGASLKSLCDGSYRWGSFLPSSASCSPKPSTARLFFPPWPKQVECCFHLLGNDRASVQQTNQIIRQIKTTSATEQVLAGERHCQTTHSYAFLTSFLSTDICLSSMKQPSHCATQSVFDINIADRQNFMWLTKFFTINYYVIIM